VPPAKRKRKQRKEKKKKEKSLGSLKEKKKINKRKKGDRKTAPPYIFSSPKVEEKIPVEAGVRARVRKKGVFIAFLCFRIFIKDFYALLG
jgi:hypothetical protein